MLVTGEFKGWGGSESNNGFSFMKIFMARQFSFKFQDNLKIQNKYYVLKCESYTPQNL